MSDRLCSLIIVLIMRTNHTSVQGNQLRMLLAKIYYLAFYLCHASDMAVVGTPFKLSKQQKNHHLSDDEGLRYVLRYSVSLIFLGFNLNYSTCLDVYRTAARVVKSPFFTWSKVARLACCRTFLCTLYKKKWSKVARLACCRIVLCNSIKNELSKVARLACCRTVMFTLHNKKMEQGCQISLRQDNSVYTL